MSEGKNFLLQPLVASATEVKRLERPPARGPLLVKMQKRLGKGAKKKGKKLTNVSFMYVCVGENVEMLVFSFFPQQ